MSFVDLNFKIIMTQKSKSPSNADFKSEGEAGRASAARENLITEKGKGVFVSYTITNTHWKQDHELCKICID